MNTWLFLRFSYGFLNKATSHRSLQWQTALAERSYPWGWSDGRDGGKFLSKNDRKGGICMILSVPDTQCIWRCMVYVSYIYHTYWPNGGFLKWWYPTTMGFPTKNDQNLGCERGVPPFKETPKCRYICHTLCIWEFLSHRNSPATSIQIEFWVIPT